MPADEPERFGCERCWPQSPEAAWAATRALLTDAELIDESHVHVTVRACGACAQRFISVFTETIDWADSEDPQRWTVMPLTPGEAAELTGAGSSVTEARLDTISRDRRSVCHDYPKDEPRRTFWGRGLVVGPHD
jgi:hypothetical protein